MNTTIAYQMGAAAQRAGTPHTQPEFGRAIEPEKTYRTWWYSGWYDSYFAHKFGEPWRSDLRNNGVLLENSG